MEKKCPTCGADVCPHCGKPIPKEEPIKLIPYSYPIYPYPQYPWVYPWVPTVTFGTGSQDAPTIGTVSFSTC